MDRGESEEKSKAFDPLLNKTQPRKRLDITPKPFKFARTQSP